MLLSLKSVMVLALLSGTMVSAQDTINRFTVSTAKPFEDVVEDLRFAIAAHNFRLTGYNRIGEVIAKREGIAFPRASVFEFCNLEYGQKILERNPRYLLHMPCRIAVYEQGELIIVDAFLLPESDPQKHRSITEINQIIKAIVRYAAE